MSFLQYQSSHLLGTRKTALCVAGCVIFEVQFATINKYFVFNFKTDLDIISYERVQVFFQGYIFCVDFETKPGANVSTVYNGLRSASANVRVSE